MDKLPLLSPDLQSGGFRGQKLRRVGRCGSGLQIQAERGEQLLMVFWSEDLEETRQR